MSFQSQPKVVMLSYARDETTLPGMYTRQPESAVITGHIDDTDDSVSPASSSIGSLRVNVAGTHLSSAVARDGGFTLYGVPPGTVHLEITGGAVDASVTIPGVETQDQIHIGVRM